MTNYETSILLAWVSAIIFFAGLIVVILGYMEIGGVVSIVGGVLLLISYIWVKYALHKMKIQREGEW